MAQRKGGAFPHCAAAKPQKKGAATGCRPFLNAFLRPRWLEDSHERNQILFLLRVQFKFQYQIEKLDCVFQR